MGRLSSLLTGLSIGAGWMYFYDPQQGNRRRAVVRDQITSMVNSSDEFLDKAMRDLQNRSRGVRAELMGRVSGEPVSDWVLAERVRAEIGRATWTSTAIEVSVQDGKVILTGPVLADEVDGVIKRVSRVPGVKGVESRMDVHQTPGDVPGLQGLPRQRGGNPEVWNPTARLLATVGGGYFFLNGTFRRGLSGLIMRTAGALMMVRAITNRDLKHIFGIGGERDAVRIQKAINIDAPVDQIYNFWSNLENLPNFMENVNQVKEMGAGRYHWTVSGPAGSNFEWDAMVTEQVPNEKISWKTTDESDVSHEGFIRFRENKEGGTRITVQMAYTPPAGVYGHTVATLLGENPKQQMDEDMVRLKSLFEQGETTVKGRKVKIQDVAGRMEGKGSKERKSPGSMPSK